MREMMPVFEKFRLLLLCEARRDTKNPVAFAAKYLWIFFLCFIYGFFFKTAVWHRQINLDGYSMDFPLFIVSGFIMVRMIPLSIKIFDEALKALSNSGLTEWVRLTPTSPWELFAARSVWNFALILTEFGALVCFARLLIGTPVRPFFQMSTIYPALLLFAAHAGIGMVICGLSIFLGKTDFFFGFFSQISLAFGGVFFPAEMLRKHLSILSGISDILPITHALHVMRFHLIHLGTETARRHEWILVFLAVGYLSMGFLVLQRALLWAKKRGNFG